MTSSNPKKKTSQITKSEVVSLRLAQSQLAKLKRLSRRMGNSTSQAAGVLIEESLRRADFGFIDFKDSAIGRQAFIVGTGLQVWEIVVIARSYDMNTSKTAEHLSLPGYLIEAAFNYANAYPDEIEHLIQDNQSYDYDRLKVMLPSIETFNAGT